MHFVLAIAGELRVRAAPQGPWALAAGLLTAPDLPHELDASGVDVLIVFLDPESLVGAALPALAGPSHRAIGNDERDALVRDTDPLDLMRHGGAAWTEWALSVLEASPALAEPRRRPIHPGSDTCCALVCANGRTERRAGCAPISQP
jgi:hypothetical protein